MNLNYEEVSIEEADRIIKTANLLTLAELVVDGTDADAFDFAKSILSN